METNHVTNSNSSILPYKRKREEDDEEKLNKIRALIDSHISILQDIKKSIEVNNQDLPKYLVSQFSALTKGDSQALQTAQYLENNQRSEFPLPPEMLARIFSFLDYTSFFNVQQVCKVFARVSGDKACSVPRNLALATKILKPYDLPELKSFFDVACESLRIGYWEILKNGQRSDATEEQIRVYNAFLETALCENFVQQCTSASEATDLIEIVDKMPNKRLRFRFLSRLFWNKISDHTRNGEIENALLSYKDLKNVRENYQSAPECYDYNIFWIFKGEVGHRKINLSNSLVLAEKFKAEEIQGQSDVAMMEKIRVTFHAECDLEVICSICILLAKRHEESGNAKTATELFSFAKQEIKKRWSEKYVIFKSVAFTCLCNIALSENEVGFESDAAKTIEVARTYAKSDIDLLVQVAQTQVKMGSIDSAKSTFSAAKKLVKSNQMAQFLLKKVIPFEFSLGNKKGTKEAYNQALELESKELFLGFKRPDFSFMGYVLEQRWFEQALKLQKYLQPTNLEYYAKFIDYYVDQNQPAEADKILDVCNSEAYEYTFAHMAARVAYAYEKQNFSHLARKTLSKVKDPKFQFMAFLSLVLPEGHRIFLMKSKKA